eukprot:2703030-Alexandrium_andersonii.AAC.1
MLLPFCEKGYNIKLEPALGGPVKFVSARGGCSSQHRSCVKCPRLDLACFLVSACRPCASPPAGSPQGS